MSSVLDALTPEQRAEMAETLGIRHLEKTLVRYGLERLLEMELVKEVRVTAPGAGSEWKATVPAGATWEILSIHELLTASAVVANRTASLQVLDPDGNSIHRLQPGGVVTANTAVRENWIVGYGVMANTAHQSAPLSTPPIPLVAGWSVGSITAGFDVGDAYTLILLVVREWSPSAVVHAVRSLLIDLDSAGGIY